MGHIFIAEYYFMTAAIIQARFGATRLPGKIMKELQGKPMLWHVVNRVSEAKKIDKVIVATTVNPEDDAVEKLAKKEGWDYFRGSAEDVLERYYQAAKQFGAGVIVRITADCPLIAPEIIDECVQKFAECRCDYASNINPGERTFPRGLDVEVFSFEALERAFHEATQPYEREHVTPYLWENKQNKFRIGPIIKASKEYAGSYRLTVDYPEDFELIEKIYQNLYKPGNVIDIRVALSFLEAHPEVSRLNAHCEQKPVK